MDTTIIDKIKEQFIILDKNNKSAIEEFLTRIKETELDTDSIIQEIIQITEKAIKRGKYNNKEIEKINKLMDKIENNNNSDNDDIDDFLKNNKDILELFLLEAEENIEGLENCLVQIEGKTNDKKIINELFRRVHNLKSITSTIGLKEATKFIHKLEDTIGEIRKKGSELNDIHYEIMYKGIDRIKSGIALVKDKIKGNKEKKKEPDFNDLINRLSFKEAENINKKEIITTSSIESIHLKSEFIKVKAERIDYLINMVGELVIVLNTMKNLDVIKNRENKELEKIFMQLNRKLSLLQDTSLKLRMVPISVIMPQLSRVVKDITRKEKNKEIDFVMHVGDTEIDRKMLDELMNPLLHIVRNCADHGIELNEERIKKGKPKKGKIEVKAFYKGKNIIIEITDDGRGFDKEKILEKAISKGIVKREIGEKMSEQEIYNLVFTPGFSTADKITEVSGRGVGMDVVNNVISALSGKVEIFSEKDKGSLIRLILPLTLSIIDGIIVRIESERFVIPLGLIKAIIEYDNMYIHTVSDSGSIIKYGDTIYRLVDLIELFDIKKENRNYKDKKVIIIVETKREPVAIIVNEIIDKQSIVIKPTGNLKELQSIKYIGGGTILNDGKVGLILNLYDL